DEPADGPTTGSDPADAAPGTISVTSTSPTTSLSAGATPSAIQTSPPRSYTVATATSTSATTSAGETTTVSTDSTGAAAAAAQTTIASIPADSVAGSPQVVRLRFESWVDDVSAQNLTAEALGILNDPRGWTSAGFSFVADPDGPYRVVLAEGDDVDRLCLPLETFGTVSCQNGPVVALNADRWRSAVDHWVLGVDTYRGYLVNHEVGHLIGQRHPKPRCPVAGRPAGVMEQQTAGLEGCVGNPWPRAWELAYAARRPVVYAPLPAWAPVPVPENRES
ncbi:MAG: DUF3152 domain-containing protein, partial [Acidimicrobiales bacterium]